MEQITSKFRQMSTFVFKVAVILVINSSLMFILYNCAHQPIARNAYPPYKLSRGVFQNGSSESRSADSLDDSFHAVGPGNSPESTSTCYRQVQFWMGPRQAVEPKEYKCEGVRCGIRHVEDTSLQTMQKSNAVVLFHRSPWDWTEMHKHRPRGQKWLFYTLESPRHTSRHVIPPAPYYSNSYDYTIGYRERSTFIANYGYYDPTEPQIKESEPRNWAGEKSRLVAWMASNCHTSSWRRLDFVKALSRHIQVDMYGACGNLNCPRNTKCAEILKDYKFYLAIENSECRDYITEKFWRNSLMGDVVPVVYGTIKEDYKRVAPPHSFVHLHDFTSLADVADFLKKVDANDTMYNSYLEWKEHGSIKSTIHSEKLGPKYLCKVVQRLLEDEAKEAAGTKVNSSVPDLNAWWTGSCNVGSGFPREF